MNAREENKKLKGELVEVDRREFDHLRDKVYELERDVVVFRAETKSELTLLLSKSEAAFTKIDTLCDEQKKISVTMTAGKWVGVGVILASIPNGYEFFIKVVLPIL